MTAWLALDVDLHDDLLDYAGAATLAGVDAATVRQWKRRGHLHPVGLDEFGRPLFHGVDVLRAQTCAERNAARTQAHNLARRRASRTA